jgi:hypothetical protein
VDRRERVGLAKALRATGESKQAKNLEQVGILGRGKPSFVTRH